MSPFLSPSEFRINSLLLDQVFKGRSYSNFPHF
jgi:hypothetical protein